MTTSIGIKCSGRFFEPSTVGRNKERLSGYLFWLELQSKLLSSLQLINLKAFLFHTLHISFATTLQPSNTHRSPLLQILVSTVSGVTPLFTIFQILSQVFGLAGCLAFSPAITGLRGFSNGAFEEITLFCPSSGEKMETFGH